MEKTDNELNAYELFNHAPVMMHSIGPDGCLISVTDHWLEKLGYERHEVIGKKSTTFLTPESAKMAAETVLPEFYRTGRCSDIPYCYVKKNGDIIDTLLSAISVKDSEGKVLRSIAVIRDITKEKKLSDELAYSETLFRLGFDQSPVGAVMVGLDKIFIRCNLAFCNFLGHEEQDLLNHTIADVTWPEDQEVGMKEIAEIAKGSRQSFSTRKRYKHKGGYPVWGEISIKMVRDPRGNPLHFLAIIQDIDHDVRGEHELLRMKSVFDQAAWGMIMADHVTGNIIGCNHAAASMHGFSHDEIMGKHLSVLFSPESLKKLPEHISEAAEKGSVSYESVHIRKDGSRFPCMTYTTVYRDEEGIIRFRAANLVDITEKKSYEESLRIRNGILSATALAAREFFKAREGKLNVQPVLDRLGEIIGVSRAYIFENTFSSIGDVLTSQRYEWVAEGINPQISNPDLQNLPLGESGFGRWVEQMSKGEAIMGLVEDLPESERLVLSMQDIKSILVVPIFAGHHWWGFIGFDVCDRDYVWSELEINSLKSMAGILGAAIGRLNDEAELHKAIEQAELSDRLKSAFLANMSHEIRTPMNSILGFAEMLSDPGLSQEERARFSEIITSRSADLMHIINDILEISRIESGNAKVSVSEVSMNTMIGDLQVEYLKKLEKAGKTNITLHSEKPLPQTRSIIKTDPYIIKQVFSNLLDNAIKYTGRGSIRFGYHIPSGGHLSCFVSDTGMGIAKENQEVIFEHFRQADADTWQKFGGTGLGLSICKGSLELLGGNIRVESEPGAGSTFFFSIPFEQAGTSHLTDEKVAAAKPAAEKSSLKGKKIMLVEDEEFNMDFLQISLRGTGADLVCAYNGAAVRNLYPELHAFDIILLDMRLPDANGWDLAREIKSLRPSLPVIAQTAFAMSADMQKSTEAGCDAHISKPVSRERLIETISRLL
jgi:PAS domain S-box-containing protein